MNPSRAPRPPWPCRLNLPDASAAVTNITATEATAPGWITAHSEPAPIPWASNLNLERTGQTLSDHVTVRLGTDGMFQLTTQSGTHLVADLAGAGTSLHSAPPLQPGIDVKCSLQAARSAPSILGVPRDGGDGDHASTPNQTSAPIKAVTRVRATLTREFESSNLTLTSSVFVL